MKKAKQNSSTALEFDQDTIRRFIGLIALMLPIAVSIAAWKIPDSISGSYHEPAAFPFTRYFPAPRDIFVGSLFMIGAFLMSYKGHEQKNIGKFWQWLAQFWHGALAWGDKWRKHQEDIISTIGGISAWIVALFPTEILTEKALCQTRLLPFSSGQVSPSADVLDTVSGIHFGFAAVLFLTTVYFCLVAFRVRLNSKIQQRGTAGAWYQDPLKWRMTLYYIAGLGILSTILLLALFAIINGFIGEENTICFIYNQTYWAEFVMLMLFATAWITASKPFFLQDRSEKISPGTITGE